MKERKRVLELFVELEKTLRAKISGSRDKYDLIADIVIETRDLLLKLEFDFHKDMKMYEIDTFAKEMGKLLTKAKSGDIEI